MTVAINREVKVRVSPRRLALLASQTQRRVKTKKKFSELSVAFVSDKKIQTLNHRFRRKNKPTDVLSFDYGEIFISVPTARRQAKAHHLSLSRELELLFVHGLLHILGFDHETDKEKRQMGQWERKILGYSGLIEKNS